MREKFLPVRVLPSKAIKTPVKLCSCENGVMGKIRVVYSAAESLRNSIAQRKCHNPIVFRTVLVLVESKKYESVITIEPFVVQKREKEVFQIWCTERVDSSVVSVVNNIRRHKNETWQGVLLYIGSEVIEVSL